MTCEINIMLENPLDYYLFTVVSENINSFYKKKDHVHIKIENKDNVYINIKNIGIYPMLISISGKNEECIKFLKYVWNIFCEPMKDNVSVNTPYVILKDNLSAFVAPFLIDNIITTIKHLKKSFIEEMQHQVEASQRQE